MKRMTDWRMRTSSGPPPATMGKRGVRARPIEITAPPSGEEAAVASWEEQLVRGLQQWLGAYWQWHSEDIQDTQDETRMRIQMAS